MLDEVHERTKSLLFVSLFCCSINVLAQSVQQEPEPAAIVELGGAAAQGLKGGGSSFGGDLAVEFTPIKKWLEIEAGTTPLFQPSLDRMGYGPSVQEALDSLGKSGVYVRRWSRVVHTRAYGVTTNSLGGEVALDFMFWPSSKHRFGWFIEPGYDYSFARGHEHSIGISGGLLIAISRRR